MTRSPIRSLFLGMLCLMAVPAAAQEAAIDAMTEVVKAPLATQPVTAPDTGVGWFTAHLRDTAAFLSGLQRAESRTDDPELASDPQRLSQCTEAEQFFLSGAFDPKSDAALTKAAVLDACLQTPRGVTFAHPAVTPPALLADSDTPLVTEAEDLQLDLSQRAVFALTLIAVSTAKEAVINEGLGVFVAKICDDADLRPYFTHTCDTLVIGETTGKDGQRRQLRSLTLKQIGSTLQEAMRADVDEALPTLIADFSLRLTGNERLLLPIIRATLDTLRSNGSSVKGSMLARNLLLDVDCSPTTSGLPSERCAAVKLLATGAAMSLDAGCTSATACTNALLDVIAADALGTLQEWGARKGVTIPSPPAGQRFDVSMLNTLPADTLARLKESREFQSLVLWNGSTLTNVPQLYTGLGTFLQANKPAPPSVAGYLKLIEQTATFAETIPGFPPDVALEVRHTLQRVDPRVTSALDMALVAYRAAQSLRKGENALNVAREAALRTTCDPARLTDFACGFRFTGVALESIIHVEGQTPPPVDLSDPAQRAAFITNVTADLQRRLADAENVGVEQWATERLLAYRPYAAFADGLLDPVITLDGTVKKLRALRAATPRDEKAIEAASQAIVTETFNLLQAAFALVPLETVVRDQAVRVLGDVEQGWLGVQQKNYVDVIDAVIRIGADFCRINDDVVTTFATYRPLLEAFTAAQSKEEFTTAIESFIDAAPTAVDLQQYPSVSALSMYVGAAAGAAWVRPENEKRTAVPSFAPYVPVGIELSWKKTWGAMLSLVDVGAVAALYVRGGESEVPEARLSNIFSPGLVLRRAWQGKPYAAGISAAMVPDLDGSGRRAPRVAFFVAYQRPLLRIFPFRPAAALNVSVPSRCP